MKKALVISMTVITLLIACKKDSKEDQVSLLGKWTLENIITKDYSNGILTDTDTEPGIGTTLEFQNNGNLYSIFPGGTENVQYSIKPDSKVEIDGEIYEMRNLTASTVTLFIRDDFALNEYQEVYINLIR